MCNYSNSKYTKNFSNAELMVTAGGKSERLVALGSFFINCGAPIVLVFFCLLLKNSLTLSLQKEQTFCFPCQNCGNSNVELQHAEQKTPPQTLMKKIIFLLRLLQSFNTYGHEIYKKKEYIYFLIIIK